MPEVYYNVFNDFDIKLIKSIKLSGYLKTSFVCRSLKNQIFKYNILKTLIHNQHILNKIFRNMFKVSSYK